MPNAEGCCIDKNAYEMLTRRMVLYHKIISIPVGIIKRNLFGTFMGLEETDVYRYLESPGDESRKQEYINYCKIARDDNPDRSIETYNSLIAQITEEGYDINKGAIVVDQFNCVLDGQHRACIIKYFFGDDYIVSVLKLYYLYLTPKNMIENIKYELLHGKTFTHKRPI